MVLDTSAGRATRFIPRRWKCSVEVPADGSAPPIEVPIEVPVVSDAGLAEAAGTYRRGASRRRLESQAESVHGPEREQADRQSKSPAIAELGMRGEETPGNQAVPGRRGADDEKLECAPTDVGIPVPLPTGRTLCHADRARAHSSSIRYCRLESLQRAGSLPPSPSMEM